MICKNCQKEIEDNSTFCIFCGAMQEAVPVAVPVEAPVPEAAPTVEEKPKKKKKGCLIAAIITAVALLLVGGIILLILLGAAGILGFSIFGIFKVNQNVTHAVNPEYGYQVDVDDNWDHEDSFIEVTEDYEDMWIIPEETQPYQAVAEKYDSYVISNSDRRYLCYNDIDHLTDEERYIAEMEIYARQGQTFSDADVQAYFDARHWYYGSGGSFNPNAYEEANLELFDVYRRKQDGSLYEGNNVYINAFPSHPEYAISYSNTRYLTDSDLRNMTENQLCVARNEILARRGRIFKDPYLREYFLSQPWYKPTTTTVDFGSMSLIEQSNYSMIEKYEDQAEIAEGATWSASNPYKVVYDQHGSVAYLFPNSSSEYLTARDLYGMTQEELCIARCEIYARHGYIFNDFYLDEYFIHRNWYTAVTSNESAIDFNAYELANIQLILEAEEAA